MPTLYPIRAVAKLTGIPVDTLRAWERRYRAVTPDRSARGRLYSDAEVRRLLLLRTAVDGGH
ncbi:MAG: MerR family transcriptional regulator, partial [Acidobacteria bacterium]|nr:MerR family transcriptional regulator [Acidobacteriota bacterium]